MQRTLLIAVASAVVAAGIATTATVLLTGDDDPDVAIASPSPTATAAATTDVQTPAPTSSPVATEGDDGDATAEPDETTAPTAEPGVTIRAAKNVDCGDEPAFCSSSDEMELLDERRLDSFEQSGDPKSTSRPTITMTSEVRKPNKQKASEGDEVGAIHVEVVVTNASDDTFTFAKREIVLEILKGGKVYDTFSTTGTGFDMTPGTKMNGTFDRPITEDGSYSWRAKIWYYRR
jgi:hypothetical protein